MGMAQEGGRGTYGHIVSYIERIPGTFASFTCRRKYKMKFLTFSGTKEPIDAICPATYLIS